MNQSAAYVRVTDDTSSDVTTTPTLLIAVCVSSPDGAGAVGCIIYDGTVLTGDPMLTMSTASGTTATFTPAAPILLHNGLGISVSPNGELTVIYA